MRKGTFPALASPSLRVTDIMSIVERCARKPHCSCGEYALPLAIVSQTAGDNFEEDLACVCHKGNASVVTTLCRALLLVQDLDGGVFPLLITPLAPSR